MKDSQFLVASIIMYCLTVVFIAAQLDSPDASWLFSLSHFVLAAIANTVLLRVIKQKSLSLLASPAVSFLVVSQIYFTLNAVKYFVPNEVYPQFHLVARQRFIGSMVGGCVLLLAIQVLRYFGQPQYQAILNWATRYRRHIGRMMLATVVLSLFFKVMLYFLDYGTSYSGAIYTVANPRGYFDLLLLFAEDFFSAMAVILCIVRLSDSRASGHPLTIGDVVAMLGLVIALLWSFYLAARMAFFFLALLLVFSAQLFSFRKSILALQLLLIMFPILSVFGANQFTAMLGRTNVRGLTLEDNIAQVGYRTDLTDFATALLYATAGQATDPAVVADSLINIVPRALMGNKEGLLRHAYRESILDLNWPNIDYLDTLFSAGAMALGTVGFLTLPVLYVVMLCLVTRAAQRLSTTKSHEGMYLLLALAATSLHIELSWSIMLLNLRHTALYCSFLIILAILSRGIKISAQPAATAVSKASQFAEG